MDLKDIEIKKILLATDGSDETIKVDEYAAKLARSTGAHVVVVTAFNPPLTIRKRGSIMVEEIRQHLAAEAQEIVAEVETDLGGMGISTSGLAVEGSPAEAILRAAEEEQPDLIVIGAGGRGELKHFLLGSVAERVLRHAEVPVTVVK